MKSLSAHYISNPSLVAGNSSSIRPQPTDEPNEQTNESTYSFRREFNKLRSAKSHGELYHPQAPLPLPATANIIPPEENENPYRTKHASESPSSLASTRSRSQAKAVPIIVPPVEEAFHASSSQKKTIWKRFKQIITPTKNKDPHQPRKNSAPQVPSLHLKDLSTDQTSMKHAESSFSPCYLIRVEIRR